MSPGPSLVIDDFALEAEARRRDQEAFTIDLEGVLGNGSSGRVRVRWGRVAALAMVTLLASVGAWMALRDTATRLDTSPAAGRAVAPPAGDLASEPDASAEILAPQPGDFQGLETIAEPSVVAPEVQAPQPEPQRRRSSSSGGSSSGGVSRQPSSTATFNHFQGSGGLRGPSYPSWFGSRETCRKASCRR